MPGIINVKEYGAKGDGSTDDTSSIQSAFDASFGDSSSPNGRQPGNRSNSSVYFPRGNYRITSALTLTSVSGFRIYGDGLGVTCITQSTSGASTVVTNGMEYGSWEGISFIATDPGTGNGSNGGFANFDYDWDGGAGAAAQAVSFYNCKFYGGHQGIRVGNGGSGSQGSENLFINCQWENCRWGGLSTRNFNALHNCVIGGSVSGCYRGMHCRFGSIPLIVGVTFSNAEPDGIDISIVNQALDCYYIAGCKTSNPDFITDSNGASGAVFGCYQTSATSGNFLSANNSSWSINGCHSVNGRIRAGNAAQITMSRSWFQRDDWLQMPAPKAIASYVNGSTCVNAYGMRYDLDGGQWQEYLSRRWEAGTPEGNSKWADYSVGSYTTENLQS